MRPFEGSIREHNDQEGLFVLLSAPVVRRLPPMAVRRVPSHRTARLPARARVLFIRSQMSEHRDGPTVEDELTIRFQADGVPMEKNLAFRRLASIDKELDEMTKLADQLGTERIVLETLDLSKVTTEGAADALRHKLSQHKYELVHYAGHAWSSGFSGREANLLVLPGSTMGEAVGFAIDEFAELTANAGAWFVYLSACRGTSTRSVRSFVTEGVPHALGFRCNVEDKHAAEFAAKFYGGLFSTGSLCRSFQEACASAHRTLKEERREEDNPIWITPIMLAQSRDWARPN